MSDPREAWNELTSVLWDRINHNRLLINIAQGLSRFLAWIGGHREDANDNS